jgi:hypothetical protein
LAWLIWDLAEFVEFADALRRAGPSEVRCLVGRVFAYAENEKLAEESPVTVTGWEGCTAGLRCFYARCFLSVKDGLTV